jgi:hypothetical protein
MKNKPMNKLLIILRKNSMIKLMIFINLMRMLKIIPIKIVRE